MHCSCTIKSDEKFMLPSIIPFFHYFAQTDTFSRVTEVGHWISKIFLGKPLGPHRYTEITHFILHETTEVFTEGFHFQMLHTTICSAVFCSWIWSSWSSSWRPGRMSPKISNEARCPSLKNFSLSSCLRKRKKKNI